MATTTDSIRMGQDTGNSKSLATLVVLHGKRSYTIADLDPQTTTVGDLKTKIFDESSVPQSLQKLIVKGKGLLTNDDQTLAEVGFKTKGRVTMIGNPLDKVMGATTGVQMRKQEDKKKEEVKEEKPKRWSESKEHEKVISKGIPDDAEEGIKDKNYPVPKSIRGVLNSRGDVVRLTFRSEIQELWVASKDKTEKIPYLQVRDVASDPIHLNESYHILALQIGPMPTDLLHFYYVPAHYVRSIKYTLLATGGGAGLISMLSDTVTE